MNKAIVLTTNATTQQLISEALKLEFGMDTLGATTQEEALQLLSEERVSIAFMEVDAHEGLSLMENSFRISPRTALVGMGYVRSGQDTVSLTRQGMYDFVDYPYDIEQIFKVCRNAVERSTLTDRSKELELLMDDKYRIVGHSKPILEMLYTIKKLGPHNASVMITGPNGAGKELAARAIHRNSKRKDGKFVEVNCAAIPRDLLEVELFGARRGSYTGSVEDKEGKFEAANGGTLFLDEIGDLPFEGQTKLLRVLQERKVTRVGETKDRSIDVRVVAATNQHLEAMITKGQFREDLYHRLNVLELRVPPLDERKEDIPLLASKFLADIARHEAEPTKKITPQAVQALERKSWPGNVREFRNAMERLHILSDGEVIQMEDVKRLVLCRKPLAAAVAFEPTAGQSVRV